MKKLLLLILIGFIFTSILALSFTFQASNSFKGFEGDDNADDDKVENNLLENPIIFKKKFNRQFQKIEKIFILTC